MNNKINTRIDFFLCLFLGYLGIHKFYEKKYGIGILYFFTLGLFSLGWIYDCIKLGLTLYRLSSNNSSSNNVKAVSNQYYNGESFEDFLICKVVGVTFNNDDGSSRQEYIKNLDEDDILSLKHYIYEGRDALYVLDSKGHILGNIAHKDVKQVMKYINTYDELAISVDEKDSFISDDNKKIYYLIIRIDTI